MQGGPRGPLRERDRRRPRPLAPRGLRPALPLAGARRPAARAAGRGRGRRAAVHALLGRAPARPAAGGRHRRRRRRRRAGGRPAVGRRVVPRPPPGTGRTSGGSALRPQRLRPRPPRAPARSRLGPGGRTGERGHVLLHERRAAGLALQPGGGAVAGAGGPRPRLRPSVGAAPGRRDGAGVRRGRPGVPRGADPSAVLQGRGLPSAGDDGEVSVLASAGFVLDQTPWSSRSSVPRRRRTSPSSAGSARSRSPSRTSPSSRPWTSVRSWPPTACPSWSRRRSGSRCRRGARWPGRGTCCSEPGAVMVP